MNEELLQYIWQHKFFSLKDLKTVTNETVLVQSVGILNTNAGPDFSTSKIKIGETLWVGNVELHLKTSDWTKHNHQNDKLYNTVILHVVWENDTDLNNNIPVLELNKLVSQKLLAKHQQLMQSEKWIACEDEIQGVSKFQINNTIDRLLVERLESKSQYILQLLEFNNGDWEETLYQSLARAFGLKVNSEIFELLAKSIRFKVLSKHRDNLLQVEALLFGQAGFLTGDCQDEYFLNLKKEYKILRQKFSLQPIDKHLWKFLRLRPTNFPTIRLSQFAQLIHSSNNLFSKILEAKKVEEISLLFKLKASEYWDTHYVFDKESQKKTKNFGKMATEVLLINTIIPFLFIYGKQRAKQVLMDKALQFLEEIDPENNSIISKFNGLGIKVTSAYQSQGLLQLENEYCTPKNCLKCTIASELLK